jgi:hypothetical protein
VGDGEAAWADVEGTPDDAEDDGFPSAASRPPSAMNVAEIPDELVHFEFDPATPLTKLTAMHCNLEESS